MTKNSELKNQALTALKGRWGIAIGGTVIYGLINSAGNSFNYGRTFSGITIGMSLLLLIISGPLSVGFAGFVLRIARNEPTDIERIFDGFKNFKTNMWAFFLILAYVLLWMLLLIIPGIIAALSYSQVYYILADDPTLSPEDALVKSKKMMDGKKWKFFGLALSFIGWYLLSVFTLFIGLLWIVPYQRVTLARFYDDIKEGEIPHVEVINPPVS